MEKNRTATHDWIYGWKQNHSPRLRFYSKSKAAVMEESRYAKGIKRKKKEKIVTKEKRTVARWCSWKKIRLKNIQQDNIYWIIEIIVLKINTEKLLSEAKK